MQLLNDRSLPEKRPSGVNPLVFVSQTLLISIGLGSFALAPLCFVYVYLHSDFLPARVSALVGAVVALLFLEMPVEQVLFFFSVSSVLGELIHARRPFWAVVSRTVGFAIAVFCALIAWGAHDRGMAALDFFDHRLASLIMNIQTLSPSLIYADTARLESFLRFQAPLLMPFLWIWYTIGVAANLHWFPPGHPLSGSSLRCLTLPRWGVLAFLAASLSTLFAPPGFQPAALIAVQMGFVVFYVQGFLLLSSILHVKKLSISKRRLLYGAALIIGMYPLAIVGLLGTAIGRKNKIASREETE